MQQAGLPLTSCKASRPPVARAKGLYHTLTTILGIGLITGAVGGCQASAMACLFQPATLEQVKLGS